MKKVPKDNEFVRDFLNHSFPQSVKIMFFNDENQTVTDIDDYLPALTNVAAHVRETFYVNNFEISNTQLAKLLEISKHCTQWVGISNCKINSTSAPDFAPALNSYHCKVIDFGYSGRDNRSGWNTNPEYFGNIVKGFAEARNSIKNLKQIYVGDWNVGKARKYMHDNGLSSIKIETP